MILPVGRVKALAVQTFDLPYNLNRSADLGVSKKELSHVFGHPDASVGGRLSGIGNGARMHADTIVRSTASNKASRLPRISS